MTVTVSPVFLLDVAQQAAVPADLLDAITDRQLADWEGEWMPELFKSVQRLHRAGIERSHWPQSRHWNWRQKTTALLGFLAHQGFSVVCNGMTQGMMVVDTTTHRCRIPEQHKKELVYVEFIENAPWNRPELGTSPLYRGVGSVLVRAAVALSEDMEFKGRIGLHSLPQANGFYANHCGMTDLGIDADHQDMRYFEMTTEQANAFIAEGN